jgi:putative dehydrogenase
MRSERSAGQTVGVIGLGIMGRSYARHLRAAGWCVQGYDLDTPAMEDLASMGGKPASSPGNIARSCDVILLALPSETAITQVVHGEDGLLSAMSSGTVLCEMGTFSVDFKREIAAAVSESGGLVLDCPVSGTGAQAAERDIVVFASGDRETVESLRPVFDAIARETRYVGPFGDGMKLKLVANLLVAVHNLAAAEALLFARQSGLDLQMAFDAITAGAGTSRMLEVRGPMMVGESYTPPTMKHDVFIKDVELILDAARQVGSPTPLMDASRLEYLEALTQGRGGEDTASLFASLQARATDADNSRT